MKTIFDDADFSPLMQRVEALSPDSQRQWGKMNAAQMMAHVSRTVELSLGLATAPSEANWFMRRIIKPFAIGNRQTPKNSPTAKAFRIDGERDFDAEKQKLIQNLKAAKERGLNGEWMPSVSFGPTLS